MPLSNNENLSCTVENGNINLITDSRDVTICYSGGSLSRASDSVTIPCGNVTRSYWYGKSWTT